MIDVQVKVPEDRVAEFYAMFGQWLAGQPGPAATALQPAAEQAVTAWDALADVELAREYWGKLSSPAHRLLSMLVAEPGRRFTAEELADSVGLAKGKYGVAGVLAWPGRYAAGAGRRFPVSYEAGPSGASANYWVTDEIASLFAKVGA